MVEADVGVGGNYRALKFVLELAGAEPFGGTKTHHRMPPNTVTARVA